MDMVETTVSPEISIVFPAFNEAHNIEHTLNCFCEFLQNEGYSFELLVVNDASTDETGIILDTLSGRLDTLKVVHLEQNSGKGAAVRNGIMASTGRYIFFTDSDLIISFDSFKYCIDSLTQFNHDFIIGNRRSGHSISIGSSSISRRLVSSIFITFTRAILLRDIFDTQCPLKGFSHEVAMNLFCDQIVTSYAFDVEILYRAKQLGLKISQIPVTWFDKRDRKPLGNLAMMLVYAMKDVMRVKLFVNS
jgi:dolichyl-phosphate beta-glucosyltransferase